MNKLAIVGSHPDTRQNAPFNFPDYDIWVFNEAAMANPKDTPDDQEKQWCKRWDVCFQLHKPEIYRSPHNRSNANHWQWLQRKHGDKTIYMQDVDELVPNSVRYPLENVIESMGIGWFTSSFAYAMALAIYQGYTEIDIYGMDLVSNTEYKYQESGFRFWVGYALGRGVTVNIKCWPGVFDAPLYGYDGDVMLGSAYYQERAEVNKAAWKNTDRELTRARELVEKFIRQEKLDKLPQAVMEYQTAAIECGKASGALSEAERYASYGNRPVYRQEYEYSMARSQRDGEKFRVQMYHYGGMIEYIWNVAKKNSAAMPQLSEFISIMGRHAFDNGAHLGIFLENNTYMTEYDAKVQAAGGRKSVELFQVQEVNA